MVKNKTPIPDPTPESSVEGSRESRPDGNSRTGSRRDFQIASNLCTLTIAEAPVAAPSPRIAGEQGKSIQVTIPLTARGPLPDSLVATLEGLPNRAVVAPVALDTTSSNAVQFDVQLPIDAPLGEFTGLVCRLTGSRVGHDISYCVGRGGTLTIEPAGGLLTDPSGRPLSKLELLRRNKQPVIGLPSKASAD